MRVLSDGRPRIVPPRMEARRGSQDGRRALREAKCRTRPLARARRTATARAPTAVRRFTLHGATAAYTSLRLVPLIPTYLSTNRLTTATR
jgi:hypothetical protein